MSGLAHRSGRTAGFEGGPRRGDRSSWQCALQFGSQLRRQEWAGLVNEHGHLVTHESDVALGRSDDGKARAVADARDEQKGVLHLNDDFVNATSTEPTSCAVGKAVSPDATAAKRSAASRSRPPERAIGKPSDETTTASLTPGTRSTKFAMSQLTLLAALLMVMTTPRSLRLGCVQAGALGGDLTDTARASGEHARVTAPVHRR